VRKVAIPESGPLWYAVVTFNAIKHVARGLGGPQHRGLRGSTLSNGFDASYIPVFVSESSIVP